LAGREKDYITAGPPHQDLAAIDFIHGDRGLAPSSWLRPPELEKKKQEPYLEADPVEEIRRPTPPYWHNAKPRQKAGKSLSNTTYATTGTSPQSLPSGIAAGEDLSPARGRKIDSQRRSRGVERGGERGKGKGVPETS
jgi:hypothetical protein